MKNTSSIPFPEVRTDDPSRELSPRRTSGPYPDQSRVPAQQIAQTQQQGRNGLRAPGLSGASALIMALTLVLCLAGCKRGTEPQPGTDTTTGTEAPAFAVGSDVSWLSEMEAYGKQFRDDDGNSELFAILKGLGQNSIRLRVWVNPKDPRGWSGKDDVVRMAKRASEAGMAVMIDFHYSDFFADPGTQTIPAAWTDNSPGALSAKIKEHTADVLGALKEAGVSPAWVQVGNETRNGMLWPTGKLWKSSDSDPDTPGGWSRFASLFKAGYAAVKDVFPEARVIAHIDRGDEDNDWWFKELKAQGAAFDIIGLSYYPKRNGWSNSNAALASRIRGLATTYGTPVIISEIGIEASDFADGAACISELMARIKGISSCTGIFYWEPEVYGGWKPSIYDSLGWGAYGKGAFTAEGKPSEALKALKSVR